MKFVTHTRLGKPGDRVDLNLMVAKVHHLSCSTRVIQFEHSTGEMFAALQYVKKPVPEVGSVVRVSGLVHKLGMYEGQLFGYLREMDWRTT